MRLAGSIIALIAGIFATFAAGFTLFVGGIGGALRADNAGLVTALGWGGVAFSFLTIVFGAIGIGNKSKTTGFLLIVSSLAGAVLGGTFVAVFMALALIGGILVAIGGGSTASPKASPLSGPRVDSVCAKCGSSIAVGQMFCGSCGAAVASSDQQGLSASVAESPNALAARGMASREQKNGKNLLPWLGYASLGIVIGSVAFVVFSAVSDGLRPSASTGPTKSITGIPVGTFAEEFVLGDFAVTVSSAEITRFVGSGPFRQESSPTSVYLVVKYSYRNQGSRPLGLLETPRILLRDERGIEYSPDIGASAAYATEGSSSAKVFSNVNPGVSVNESDVFEIDAAAAESANLVVVVKAGHYSTVVHAISSQRSQAVKPAAPITPSFPSFRKVDVSTDTVATSAGTLQFSKIAGQHHDEFTDENSLFGRAKILSAYDFGDGVVLAFFEKNGGGQIGVDYVVHRISTSEDEVVLSALGEAGELTQESSWDVRSWGYGGPSSGASSAWTCRYYFDGTSHRPSRSEFASNPDKVDARVCALEK